MSETLAQVFCCEFCENSKHTFFTEYLRTTTSVGRISYEQSKIHWVFFKIKKKRNRLKGALMGSSLATLCMESVQIRSFSGPYFPVFGLNMEIYFVNFRIQSKYGKIRTTKFLYFGQFLGSKNNIGHQMWKMTHSEKFVWDFSLYICEPCPY